MEKTFNSALAEELRERGIQSVEDNAEVTWRVAALLAVKRCAEDVPEFIVDEVWHYLPEEFETHELRAMGPVMRRANKAGWIVPTEKFQPSARVSAHRNPRRVWKSLLNGEEA